MSGIVGIVNFDGAPIDRVLLSRMTAALDFRGPDARHTWIAEPARESGSGPCVGFGHTLLRTTYEAEHEQQPFTLDGNTWIVADCRVDAREELLVKLRAQGRHASLRLPDASLHRPDVELILHAWHVWGEECVEHLLGDFAFAIWDVPRRRLFCARDHMGVKPFYYAHIGSTLIFSNTLDCVRMHPAVSDTLNDLAIADFLLFDLNQEKDTTGFADVQRIRPAHTATWTPMRCQPRRYWTLPIDEPVYFKRFDDYTDRFKELLGQSVKDRLRTDKVGVFMSGGLDSSTLAAVVCQLIGNDGVRAFTTTYRGYDEERHYAGLVARHLGIQVDFREGTEDLMDPLWQQTSIHTPEPVADAFNLASDFVYNQRIASHSRVVLYGEGPDNALEYEWRPYMRHLLDQGRYSRLIYDVSAHMVLHRRAPLLSSLPKMWREKRRGAWWRPEYPPWLNPDFESRLDLRTRWNHWWTQPPPSSHSIRPAGHGSFDIVKWQAIFENFDGGSTSTASEARHPFLDLRMLSFMLSVPVMPWCRVKYLERRSMSDMLPSPVLRRPKSPFPNDPVWDRLKGEELPSVEHTPYSMGYVNWQRVPGTVGGSRQDFRRDLRPLALNYWLHNLKETEQTIEEEPLRGQRQKFKKRNAAWQEDLYRAQAGALR